MKAYFVSLEWSKGSRKLIQGVKGNRVPHNAVFGGNGSFVCDVPAKLTLTVTTEDGRIVSWNIISVVRAVNHWAKITQNRVELLGDKLMQAGQLELDDKGYVVDLEKYVLM